MGLQINFNPLITYRFQLKLIDKFYDSTKNSKQNIKYFLKYIFRCFGILNNLKNIIYNFPVYDQIILNFSAKTVCFDIFRSKGIFSLIQIQPH